MDDQYDYTELFSAPLWERDAERGPGLADHESVSE